MPARVPPAWFDDLVGRVLAARSRLFGDPEVPTLVHLTHAKAGSTWIDAILRQLFHSRVAPRGRYVAEASGGLAQHVFAPGRVYSAMFLNREKFDAHAELRDAKRFIVIRDLRDTLVSLYFSLKVSHPVDASAKTQTHRDRLNSTSLDDGLIYLMDGQLRGVARMQQSWLGGEEIIVRYEDLIEDCFGVLNRTLIEQLTMPTTKAALARAVRRSRFERVFQRPLGSQDVASHGRQGLPGDWKNHFSREIRQRCAEQFGDLLIATGYEKDRAWAD